MARKRTFSHFFFEKKCVFVPKSLIWLPREGCDVFCIFFLCFDQTFGESGIFWVKTFGESGIFWAKTFGESGTFWAKTFGESGIFCIFALKIKMLWQILCLEMYPMDFEEFCWALGDKVTMPLLKQFFDSRIPLEAAHRETMRRLRLYMLVGGMPQAVKEYLETNNLSKTDAVKREILDLYLDDFRKIDNSGRAAKLFANIPAQLNKNASRYQVASVLDDSERKNIMGILE